MKKFLILFCLILIPVLVKAEEPQYYELGTPLRMQKSSFDYNPPSSLKPNKKEFLSTPVTDNVKTHYEVNTNSMPKGIYKNNFVYMNGPFGALRPTHVPTFDTQYVQF